MTRPALERGAIVWADLDPVEGREQRGRRPVLLISDSRFNRKSGTVIAMPLTTQEQKAGLPFSLELLQLRPADPRRWVKVSQVRVLSTERLGALVEHRLDSEVDECLDALLQICGRLPGEPRSVGGWAK